MCMCTVHISKEKWEEFFDGGAPTRKPNDTDAEARKKSRSKLRRVKFKCLQKARVFRFALLFVGCFIRGWEGEKERK